MGFRHQEGLTLLEMILFIVVLGVAGVALLAALSGPLSGAGTQTEAVTAAQATQARMELILGQKRKGGYPDDPTNCELELDPCQGGGPAALCDEVVPPGWSVASSCQAFGSESTDCRAVVVVTTTNPDGGVYSARTLIGNLADSECAP